MTIKVVAGSRVGNGEDHVGQQGPYEKSHGRFHTQIQDHHKDQIQTQGRSDHAVGVRGVLETTQREMTLSLEKTARSSVFNLAHDYSTALFNAMPEMILQGQDIPIHLGSLIPAMKSVAQLFRRRHP